MTRNLASAVVACLAVAGCSWRTTAAGGAAGLVLVGTGAAIGDDELAGPVVAITGVAVLAISLLGGGIGLIQPTDPPTQDELDRDRERERLAAERQRELDAKPARDAAWKRAQVLTDQARAAARGGDCATVTELEPQVHELDAGVHARWFLTDPVIAGCLDD